MEKKCSCEPRKSTGVNHLIDELTDAWFNKSTGKSLMEWQRFGFAFVGSATFFFGFVPVVVAAQYENYAIISFALDVDLGVTPVVATFILTAYAILMAFLVSWRNTRSGPTRLFLSGALLPAFVLSILSRSLG